MARKVFFSFHFDGDNWRAAQVRNAGVVEGNVPVSDNDWEEVKKGGDKAIKDWIDGQMKGRSCTVVLIGADTAGRPWIDYEIKKAWADKKGLVGIYIHKLKDKDGYPAVKGSNPFGKLQLGTGLGAPKLSSIVKAYDPPFATSNDVYAYIKTNLEAWADEAIAIRAKY